MLLAVQFNNTEVIHVLQETGADVNQQSDSSWTTLQDSAIYNRTDNIWPLISHSFPAGEGSGR